MSSTINASTASGGGLVTSADATGILQLQTAGTTALTIDGSQNVGIGTSSPNAKLQVDSSSTTYSANIRSRNSTFGNGVIGAASGILTVATDMNNIAFYTGSNLGVDGTSVPTNERMRIDPSGNVGIGTSSPGYKLDMTGQGRATTGWAVSGDGSAFTPSGLNAIPNYGIGYITSGNLVPLAGFSGIPFYTNQLERMRIDSSGRVTMPYQPAFLVGGAAIVTSSNQTYIPSSTTYNVGGHLNATTGVFTAPVTGMYLFSWILLMQSLTLNAQVDPSYYVSGNSFCYGPRGVAAANSTQFGDGYFCVTGTVIRKLVAGDTFYVNSSTNQGTFNFYNSTNWTHYMGMLVS